MHVVRWTIVLCLAARAAGAQAPCIPAPEPLALRSALERGRAIGDSVSGATNALLRSGHGCAPVRPTGRKTQGGMFAAAVHSPTLRASWLGGLGENAGEGGMWAGRGPNLMLLPSAGLSTGMLRVLIAPAIHYSANEPYDVFPGADSSRSGLSSPWYSGRRSIDLPSRFGTEPLAGATLGESAAWLSWRGLSAGVAGSSLEWGPGLRGNLLFSPDAPGVPRVFVATDAPLRTRIGWVEGQVFRGTLTESPWFDATRDDDRRSLAGVGASIRPAAAPALAVGAAHARMHSDQLNLLFIELGGRGSGARGWAEIGRAGALPTPRRFFSVPNQGLAYLAGAELRGTTSRGAVLFTLEVANLEQPTDVRGDSIQDFYTSARVPQGWTQRGRLLGHFAGPGGQSQWVSFDWLPNGRRWSAGLFGERIRRNEDAFFRQYLPYQNRHDVSLRGGARLGGSWGGQEVAIEMSIGKRLNYLFQNATFLPGYRTVDVSIPQLRLTLTPAPAR